MTGSQNGPGCAPSEPKRLCLLIERRKSGVDESLPEFPYLRRCRAFISATTGFLFFSCNELSPSLPRQP
jgi:hypothetical protein